MAASLRFAPFALGTAFLMAGAQIHRPVYSPMAPPQNFPAAVPLVSVPFLYDKQHIYVTVAVNGSPGLMFLLDSGSNQSGLNLHTAEALHIRPSSVRGVMDVGLGEGWAYIASAVPVDLAIGTLKLQQKMLVVDMSGMENFSGHRIDGILGYPFFKQYVVGLDFKKNLMNIFQPEGYHYQGDGYVVPVKEWDHVPVVSARLYLSNEKKLNATVEIDTGSDATLLLYSKFQEKHHLQHMALAPEKVKAYGIGGAYTVSCASIASVHVGVLKEDQVWVQFSTAARGTSARNGIDGELGNDFLQKARGLVFDLPRGQVIFELKQSPLN